MARMTITEYGYLTNVAAIPTQVANEETLLAEQNLVVSGASNPSAAFNTNTSYVRIWTDTACAILYGATPVALVTSKGMSAGQTEYFGVAAGKKIAVIAT